MNAETLQKIQGIVNKMDNDFWVDFAEKITASNQEVEQEIQILSNLCGELYANFCFYQEARYNGYLKLLAEEQAEQLDILANNNKLVIAEIVKEKMKIKEQIDEVIEKIIASLDQAEKHFT